MMTVCSTNIYCLQQSKILYQISSLGYRLSVVSCQTERIELKRILILFLFLLLHRASEEKLMVDIQSDAIVSTSEADGASGTHTPVTDGVGWWPKQY